MVFKENSILFTLEGMGILQGELKIKLKKSTVTL